MTSNHLPDGKDLTQMSVSLFSEASQCRHGVRPRLRGARQPCQGPLAKLEGRILLGGRGLDRLLGRPEAEELIVIFMTQLLPSSAYPMRRDLRTMVYAAFEESNL